VSRCRSLALGLTAFGLLVPAAAPADAKPRTTFGERTLQQGDRGHDVRVLQDFLTRVGLETEVDGQFGPFTARRVRSWERKSSVVRVNGWVSRADARKLRGQVEAGVTVHQPTEPVTAPAGEQAVLGADGLAVAPASAPPEVHAAIAAANEIVGKPYKYGGGHGRWNDTGYDCSGAMSYALHGAGLLDSALSSGDFMSWGESGPGSWITIYAHGGHGYLVIAGLRFDTGWNNAGKGPRWSEEMRPADGYRVRHPAGL
jgi:cell wall-associated NlpC family hydrolase